MNSRASQKCLDLLWSRPSARLCGPSLVLFRSPVLFGKFCPQGYATATAPATTNKRPSTPKPPVKASSSRTTAPKAVSSPKFATKNAPTPSAKPPSGTASTLGAQRPAPITHATQTTNQTPHPSLSAPPTSQQAVDFGRGTLTKLKESAVGRRVLPGSMSKMKEVEEKVKERGSESDVKSDKGKHELTEEEQIEQIDRIMSMSRLFPTADPWGQKVETLGVFGFSLFHSPTPGFNSHSFHSLFRTPTRKTFRSRTLSNQAPESTMQTGVPCVINLSRTDKTMPRMRRGQTLNSSYLRQPCSHPLTLGLSISMYALARANGFPGIDLAVPTFRQRTLQWPRRVFQCQSLKPNAWIAPFRAIALETYKNLNTALAQYAARSSPPSEHFTLY